MYMHHVPVSIVNCSLQFVANMDGLDTTYHHHTTAADIISTSSTNSIV